jgi:hypothetical protein
MHNVQLIQRNVSAVFLLSTKKFNIYIGVSFSVNYFYYLCSICVHAHQLVCKTISCLQSTGQAKQVATGGKDSDEKENPQVSAPQGLSEVSLAAARTTHPICHASCLL